MEISRLVLGLSNETYKSDHSRLISGCVKCIESTIMSCSIKNRPEVLYKQAKVALDSFPAVGTVF